MSGGVDSAACVLLLQKQGYDVSGVTLRLHHYKDRPGTCGSADDIEEAARVAAQMGISHRVLDLCDLFRREVMGHFVSEYCAGRTPNPCLDCNRELKFGAMLDWALDHGFDYVSTGHYARVGFDAASGRHLLLRGVDAHKDQSYVLYQMTQRQLAHLLLPVGEYSKPEIRALAADFGLENAQKPDSQDICFVPDGDYAAFIRRHTGKTYPHGPFLDQEGHVLGEHTGIVGYTVGQRRGLDIPYGTRIYVVAKRGSDVVIGPNEALFSRRVQVRDLNWIPFDVPPEGLRAQAKLRYTPKTAECTVHLTENGAANFNFLLIRGISAGALHILCGVLSGFGVSYVFRRRWLAATGTVGILGACIGFHAIYNLLITADGVWKTAGYLFPSLLLLCLYAAKQLLPRQNISFE